ncbi:hypothetical protein THAOC_10170, partial [Thalassiosira oceanica]
NLSPLDLSPRLLCGHLGVVEGFKAFRNHDDGEDVEEAPYARSLGVGIMAPQDTEGNKEPAGSSMNTDSSATEDINQMTKMSVKTEEDFDDEKESDEPPAEIPGSTHAFLFTTQVGSYGLQEDFLGIPVNVTWEVRNPHRAVYAASHIQASTESRVPRD